jgi:ketosteroid isomerase-like protein
VSRENVEIVERCLDAWNRADLDAWTRDAHPEIEYASAITRLTAGRDTAFRGAEQMRAWWDEWRQLWDLRIDIDETRDAGAKVVALGSITTRSNTSGIELASPVGYVFEFDGALFRRVTTYLEPREALDAAGLSGQGGDGGL